jgi:hypothetical protein
MLFRALNWNNNNNKNNTEPNCKLIYYTAITEEAHVISDIPVNRM